MIPLRPSALFPLRLTSITDWPQDIAHLLRDQAREHVGGAPGRGADDDLHRLIRRDELCAAAGKRAQRGDRPDEMKWRIGSSLQGLQGRAHGARLNIGITSLAKRPIERSVSSVGVRLPNANARRVFAAASVICLHGIPPRSRRAGECRARASAIASNSGGRDAGG